MNVPRSLFFPHFTPGPARATEPSRGDGFKEWATYHIGVWVGTWEGFRVTPKDRLSKRQGVRACLKLQRRIRANEEGG